MPFTFSPFPDTDADFDWEELIARHNNELLKNLGNFVNRAVTFCCKNFESRVPALVGIRSKEEALYLTKSTSCGATNQGNGTSPDDALPLLFCVPF